MGSSFHATLYVGRQDARLFWTSGQRIESEPLTGIEGMPPDHLLLHAKEMLIEKIGPSGRVSRCLWRLVLPGGFYAPAARPEGRWTTDLAMAAATELEPVCPVPLDDLHTAAIPLNHTAAWVCGFPKTVLQSFVLAAQRADIALEGVWTPATAWVDFLLEKGVTATEESAFWQDGFVKVEWRSRAETDAPQALSLEKVRVYACRDRSASSDLAGLARDTSECPVEFLPGLLAHELAFADPTESLNLLRGEFTSAPLERQLQRPLAGSLALWAIALILLAAANLVAAGKAQKAAALAQSQIAKSWHKAEGSSPLPPLAITTLEQEVSHWESAQDDIPAFRGKRSSMVAALAALVSHVPDDVQLSVSSIRQHQQELWIEGQVKTQADARKLEAAWDGITLIRADPMRLSAGAGGLVSFSVRMVPR